MTTKSSLKVDKKKDEKVYRYLVKRKKRKKGGEILVSIDA
jgi:hypothetical protein